MWHFFTLVSAILSASPIPPETCIAADTVADPSRMSLNGGSCIFSAAAALFPFAPPYVPARYSPAHFTHNSRTQGRINHWYFQLSDSAQERRRLVSTVASAVGSTAFHRHPLSGSIPEYSREYASAGLHNSFPEIPVKGTRRFAVSSEGGRASLRRRESSPTEALSIGREIPIFPMKQPSAEECFLFPPPAERVGPKRRTGIGRWG